MGKGDSKSSSDTITKTNNSTAVEIGSIGFNAEDAAGLFGLFTDAVTNNTAVTLEGVRQIELTRGPTYQPFEGAPSNGPVIVVDRSEPVPGAPLNTNALAFGGVAVVGLVLLLTVLRK